MNRAVTVSLGLVAMTAGLALGSLGCSMWCRCPPPETVQSGEYEIVDSPARPELVGAMVHVSDGGVEISFTDDEGNSWVVDYSAQD
jgi:hypothetical protein